MITPEAISYLLTQGRLVFILDGFDEVSRALAQNAEQNVEQLSKSINKRTTGKLILTSRPSFVVQEDIFSSLKSACDEERHEERTLAPYTDTQMREWVIQNPPESPVASPPVAHWQRLETAFRQHPDLRDLCRTPVFLRMLSEILVKQRSVKSMYDLVEQFCVEMWDRERGKRTLTLTDEQYFYAYEAISAAAVDEARIEIREVKDFLGLYFDQYAPHLLASLPAEAGTLLDDLAIGPLTYRAGAFTFIHEVLTGYFFARLLARSLLNRNNVEELWNRRIADTTWRFMPAAVGHILAQHVDRDSLLQDIVRRSRHGLLAWNIARALVPAPEAVPRGLFRGKEIASILFEKADLQNMQFNDCIIHDVTFENCSMAGATFSGARIGKIKFIECGFGTVFDSDPIITEDSELVLIRRRDLPAETYVGGEVRAVCKELSGSHVQPIKLPPNLAEQATIVIFLSLFKVDERRLDYPETSKISNRLSAWLHGFQLPERQFKNFLDIFLQIFSSLGDKGWICRNPNRPRTLVPCETRMSTISQIIRNKKIAGYDEDLVRTIAQFQEKCDSFRPG